MTNELYMFLLGILCVKRCGVKVKNHINDDLYEHRQKNFLSRGQGARVPPKANIRKKGWLKQLKVAIST
jgi:hypothetical protein